MSARLTSKRLLSLMLVTSLSISGCSTISDLNPFGGEGVSQGDIPDDSERLTILSLSDALEIDPADGPFNVVLPPPYVNTDWRQTGGNQYHAMQHTQASGNLKEAWTRDIGKGSSSKGRVVSSPIVANNVVYALDADNKISAVDATSGAKIWDSKITVTFTGKTRLGNEKLVDRVRQPFSFFGDKGGSDTEAIGGGLAYDNGALFVSSGFGLLLKIDPNTGEEIWRVPTRTPLHSAPAVSDGRVFAISDDNEIFAFDASDGSVLWTYQGIIETARMLTSPSPAVVDDVVIAPFASGELVALRVQNGGVLWQDSLSSSGKLTPLSSLNDIGAGPVVSDGYVFATAQSGALSAYDLRTGQRVWNQPAGALGFPWVAGEYVYVVTTDGNVVCLSRADGKIVWMKQLDLYENEKKKKGRISWTGPVMAGQRLFIAGSNGDVVNINAFNGDVMTTGRIGDAVFVNPIIANETIYILTDDAKLVALR